MSLARCVITQGIEESEAGDLAILIYEAFTAKFTALGFDKPTAVEILRTSCNPDCTFTAHIGRDLVGAAGIMTVNRKFFTFRLHTLAQYFNPLKALAAYLALNLEERVAADELKIEALAVDKERRGLGIGTALIQQMEQFAREEGYKVLSLDVVDTNTEARKLYSRLGFEVVKTTRFWGLAQRAGFNSSHVMKKPLK